MFLNFFDELRQAKVPVTLKEYLALLEGMDKHVIDMKVEEFYYLSRAVLVKDERNLDKFDRVFSHAFKGLETLDPSEMAQIPEDWLKALTEKFLTEEEKKPIESLLWANLEEFTGESLFPVARQPAVATGGKQAKRLALVEQARADLGRWLVSGG